MTDPNQTTAGDNPTFHIESRVTHRRLCDGGELELPYFPGIDAAYGAVLAGYGAKPCRECVRAATFAMGVQS